jgi:hypothetical protein
VERVDRDLVVRDDICYMRTTEGLKRVDALWRRIEGHGFDWISIWDHFYGATGKPDDAACLDGLGAQRPGHATATLGSVRAEHGRARQAGGVAVRPFDARTRRRR